VVGVKKLNNSTNWEQIRTESQFLPVSRFVLYFIWWGVEANTPKIKSLSPFWLKRQVFGLPLLKMGKFLPISSKSKGNDNFKFLKLFLV